MADYLKKLMTWLKGSLHCVNIYLDSAHTFLLSAILASTDWNNNLADVLQEIIIRLSLFVSP